MAALKLAISAPPRPTLSRWGSRLARHLRTWFDAGRAYRQHRRECQQLLLLSERELRDIGISRIDAVRAAKEPL